MARHDDDYDDDYDDQPRRRRRRSGGGGGSTGMIWVIVGVSLLGVFVVCGGIMAALLLPAVQQAREAARTSQSKNNLKQIGLALYNYHDVYGTLPPGSIEQEDGTVSLSWQGSILPYVDQDPLFNQIEMGADWNGPENHMVRSTVVPVYLNPSVAEVMAPDGLPASHYAGNINIFLRNRGLRFREITDGLSNTIIVGEVTTGLKSWGDPTNLRDPADGLGDTPQQFGLRRRPSGAGAQFLMADGAVRFISQEADPEVLKALSTPDGGEIVGEF
ncbi:MAG: DUF1559 domain-containing protein [Planctomycetaceae bacterium]